MVEHLQISTGIATTKGQPLFLRNHQWEEFVEATLQLHGNHRETIRVTLIQYCSLLTHLSSLLAVIMHMLFIITQDMDQYLVSIQCYSYLLNIRFKWLSLGSYSEREW